VEAAGHAAARCFFGVFPSSVSPVLVTGILCAASAARKTLLLAWLKGAFHGADAPWLDSRHKGENDGGWGSAPAHSKDRFAWRACLFAHLFAPSFLCLSEESSAPRLRRVKPFCWAG